MISQEETDKFFWQMMFKHEGFKDYYYSIRSRDTRKALSYLIVDIQLGLRENGERIRDLHYSELKKARVINEKDKVRGKTRRIDAKQGNTDFNSQIAENVLEKESDDTAPKVLTDIESQNGKFGYEEALIRILHKLEDIGVLYKYPKTEPITRKHRVEKTKTIWYYCLDHRGMAWAPYEPERCQSEYDKLVSTTAKVYQRLERSKEIGIEAYIALGKTADDFYAEYKKRTDRPALFDRGCHELPEEQRQALRKAASDLVIDQPQ